MLKIGKNNKIFLTKGDDAELEIKVYDVDGNEVEITANDTLTITMRTSADAVTASLTKTAINNTFYFSHNETSLLASGCYVYDIQLNADGEISTIIPCSFFEIGEEITRC